uniref:Uncharacterized protein n=1 Tax=Salix viminalis TaxID=40686 RepID=A0A6N2NE24_SALVM
MNIGMMGTLRIVIDYNNWTFFWHIMYSYKCFTLHGVRDSHGSVENATPSKSVQNSCVLFWSLLALYSA